MFLEFINSGAAGLAGRLEKSDNGADYRMVRVKIVEEISEEPGACLRNEMDGSFDRGCFEERRAEDSAGLVLERTGEIDYWRRGVRLLEAGGED